MFVYYYTHIDRPFEQVEPQLLRMLPGLAGWAEAAYRDGEHLFARIGSRKGKIAKTVEIRVGKPASGPTESWIPLDWDATGMPGLFPQMQADVVVAAVGPTLTQIAFRGTYRVPLGKVGEVLDRTLLHRLAEASVKSFVDRIAMSLAEGPRALVEGSVR